MRRIRGVSEGRSMKCKNIGNLMTHFTENQTCVPGLGTSLFLFVLSWMFTNCIATETGSASADEHWTRTFSSSSSGSYLVTLLKHLTSDRAWSWLKAHDEKSGAWFVDWSCARCRRFVSSIVIDNLIIPQCEFSESLGLLGIFRTFYPVFALTNTLSFLYVRYLR
jgi:hypothetical protein